MLVGTTEAAVTEGDRLTLTLSDAAGWSPLTQWDNGQRGTEAVYGRVATSRTIEAYVTSQGGRKQVARFAITVTPRQSDGVEAVRLAAPQNSATAIYDLQGRRLSAPPAHGVYIVKGKKYIR